MNRFSLLLVAAASATAYPAFAQTAPSPSATGEYLLTQFGDVSKPADLQALVDSACRQIIANGGGKLIIPPSVARNVPLENHSQSVRVAGGSQPTVTILDRRDGYERTLVPPIGEWSMAGWSGTRIERSLNFDGPGFGSWGNSQPLSIENNIVHGVSSYLHPAASDAKAGKDAKIYVHTERGLYTGQLLNYYFGPFYGGGFEPIVVKSIGYDKDKQSFFFTADLTKDHVNTGYLSNKSMVGSVMIRSNQLADNQTAGDLGVYRNQYANGDSFLITGTYVYQGDVLTQQGDEGGVIYNAEPESDFNVFHSKVQSVDPARDAVIFEPGVSDVQKLASSRPLINMNEKKWITSGTVKIVGQDDWGGIMSMNPKFDVKAAVKEGVDVKGFQFTRPVSPSEDTSKLPYPELFKGKSVIPTLITWDGHPIKQFKYVYQGKAYPSLHSEGKNMLGGRIIASADCGWTKDVVGKYFAVSDDSECLYPGDKTMGGTPAAGYAPERRVYRWYLIRDFWKNPDGTCGIRLGRVRMFASGAGAPNLYDENNYTRDGHEVPLHYIIAPGAMVYDVSQGYKDAYGGVTTAADPRTIKVAAGPAQGQFETGDPIELAIGADPALPTAFRVRLWNEIPNNFGDYSSVIELVNEGRVSTGAGLELVSTCQAVDQLSLRKDRKPPFTVGMNLSSLTRDGVIFGGDVTNSALLFTQPHDRAQPIKWQHAQGTTALVVDPKTGDMAIKGSKLCVSAVKETHGISGTGVAANNLRGINVKVPAGAKSLTVKFSVPEADALYSINVQPNWFTQDAVTQKTANGFKVAFNAPAGAAASLDWQLIR